MGFPWQGGDLAQSSVLGLRPYMGRRDQLGKLREERDFRCETSKSKVMR